MRLSFDAAEFDLDLIHRFLSQEAYWSIGIPRATVERAIAHSICIAGFVDAAQIAFARVVTDQATFAYLADVFVLPEHRGRGHARALVEALMADRRVQGLRRWHLVTRDMQPLYERVGFTALTQPELHMQKHDPDVYGRASPET